MTIIGKDKTSTAIKILVIMLIFSLITIGLLMYRSNLADHLEKETFESLINCVRENSDEFKQQKDHIYEILNQYEDRKVEIEKKTISNGITSLLVTLVIILTSIRNIIRSSKGIIRELLNGKDKEKDKSECTSKTDEKNMNDYEKLMRKINEYQQLQEMIDQLNKSRQQNKEQDDTVKLIERTMMLLLEQFIGTLGQTSNYAKQIDHDKEQLLLGISEIRKGMEQIALVMHNGENKDNMLSNEEIMVAIQQIDTAIEESGFLILEMDKKVRALSKHIEQYKEGNGNHSRNPDNY